MKPTRALFAGRNMNVAFVGNYAPRQCGIATFTTDLATWVANTLGKSSDVFVVAMNDKLEGYAYPPIVRFEVMADKPEDYGRAADFINHSAVDIVCLQHEFGIYGGTFGSMITELLQDVKKPVVTTVHTILPDPDPARRKALVQVAEHSDALIVMSHKSIEFLEEFYGVASDKVHVIHHGVPDRPFTYPNEHKARWGLEGHTVILNFGLLSERKGIEYMIDALPQVVERFPDVMFVVLGMTHPPRKEREGESYRDSLKRRARELGVAGNVMFYDAFVTLEELTDFLAACDIYVTPYLDKFQIVSGTLAYAIGLGKPVVSTPYYYAEELLGEGRGVVAKFNDPQSLADGVLGLLEDPARMKEMRGKAYALGRKMIWKEVSREYVKLFARVMAGRELVPLLVSAGPQVSTYELPRPKLDFVIRLTDSTGIIHGSHYDIPDRASGYTTSDNAAALAAAALFHLQLDDARALELARTYLGFLRYMQLPDGKFHEFLRYDTLFADDVGGEECQGMALSGLGVTLALESNEGLASFAKNMFDESLYKLELEEPLAMAYAALGCYHYITRYNGATHVLSFLERMAQKLYDAYERNSTDSWRWFDDTLYAGNGLLPRAMLLAYRATRDSRYRDAGLESLEFLTQVSTAADTFDLVGTRGWYTRGSERARFEQLPIEAASLVEVYVDAYIIEREQRYLDLARQSVEWFFGRNVQGKPLYDVAAGSCADSIQPHDIDKNRSARATLSFLLALLRVTTALSTPARLTEADEDIFVGYGSRQAPSAPY